MEARDAGPPAPEAAARLQELERRLDEVTARMNLIMDNVPAGIVLLKPVPGERPDFLITAVNHNVNKVAGFSRKYLFEGRLLAECLRPAAADGMYGECEIDRRIAERMAWYNSRPDKTISIVYPADHGRFLKFTRSPVGEYGMVVLFVDITEQMRIEKDLEAARDRAEAALSDLLATQDHLVQAEKMASLGRLVAGAAHEINTPLGVSVTVASLFSQRLQELAGELAAGRLRRSQMEQYIADAREGCELLMANIQRAADLVHSFKQVAADQTSDELRRFEMGTCLADIVASIGPVWRKAGHRVDIVCPERVDLYGHPGAISQIVTNLVTNSVIHGFEPGQSGVLTIAASLPGPETVELRYSDTGKGIPPAMRSQVFEPFFTTRRNAGSTGLGLHIIYNLVVGRLGGSIELESGEGNGARFVIRFARSPEPGR